MDIKVIYEFNLVGEQILHAPVGSIQNNNGIFYNAKRAMSGVNILLLIRTNLVAIKC